MDKKNLLFGSIFLLGAALCYYISYKYYPARPNPAAVQAASGPQITPAAPPSEIERPSSEPPQFAAAVEEHVGSTITTLENTFIEVRFTDFGGAIRDVALKQYPAAIHESNPFIFNELHNVPLFAFTDLPGLDRLTHFQLVSHTANQVVYRTVLDNRLEVTRRYIVSGDKVGTTDPYQLRTETTFRNLTAQPYAPPLLGVSLGTAAPVNANDRGAQLTTGYSQNGSQTFILRSRLEPSSGFLGMNPHGPIPEMESPGPMQWVSVANQFFVSILTPDVPAAGVTTRRVKLLNKLPDTDSSAYGVTALAKFALPPIPANGSATLGANLYVGPKEYHRLSNVEVFKADQDRVMNFGSFIRFFSALLLTLLTFTHGLGVSWGVAIVLTTLFLKIVFLPFTLAASRSAKRMQKIQPELALVKEKYKDNPQKQQAATMELFKAHKVNPVGGCLPVLITLPFFWGFFRMLYSAAELRFQPFLWASDLSAPDTVGHLYGVPINILPLLLGVTMLLQMHFTPQPTVDNAQAKMMKFTPLIFMFICYSYSCALSLYSTINALFSIGQQMVINRMKDPVVATPAPVLGKGGKPVKNVTPKRR